jgi:hypothetical protein
MICVLCIIALISISENYKESTFYVDASFLYHCQYFYLTWLYIGVIYGGCLIRSRNCLPFAVTRVHPGFFGGVRVTHLFHFFFVLLCVFTLRFTHKNDVRFVFTSSWLSEDARGVARIKEKYRNKLFRRGVWGCSRGSIGQSPRIIQQKGWRFW